MQSRCMRYTMKDRQAQQIIDIQAPTQPSEDRILTSGALSFLCTLAYEFRPRVLDILAQRRRQQRLFDHGILPDFLQETRWIREGDWKVKPAPENLQRRTVEITGPTDRKMIINAMNSGANVFMADFEDSNAPTWGNLIGGQVNLIDTVHGSITYDDPTTGRHYELGPNPSILMVRPRGWHLWEEHMRMEESHIPAGLFDAGLFLFHSAERLYRRGKGPYLYLPKMQSYREAQLWNDVLEMCERLLGLPMGTIKVTVLIETLPAAFQMDEILFALRERCVGLNCGRWDYIFSTIKTFRLHPDRVTPDRSQITMAQPCMEAYSRLLIQTCHRRGAHAMGGMAAQIPLKDPERNTDALAKVRADKDREVRNGHDGTWVAHPGLVPLAREVFKLSMQGPNQLDVMPSGTITADDLLQRQCGVSTEEGVLHNMRVGVTYLARWLSGIGCVPISDLMEDAATAEISRTQLWQWVHHRVQLVGGRQLDPVSFDQRFGEEMGRLTETLGEEQWRRGNFDAAAMLFQKLCLADTLEDFLTIPAYEKLLEIEAAQIE